MTICFSFLISSLEGNKRKYHYQNVQHSVLLKSLNLFDFGGKSFGTFMLFKIRSNDNLVISLVGEI